VYLTDMRLQRPRAWERIRCFKESTGKQLWSYASELVYPDWAFIPEHGGGPAAKPIVEDGKIYSLGRSGQVDCLDARNGKVIWKKQLEYEIGELNCRASPLIEDNLLILFTGGKPGACVIALDKKSGREIWKALDENVSNSSLRLCDPRPSTRPERGSVTRSRPAGENQLPVPTELSCPV